ncbi:MAG: tRNA lysidine(34) synthetase TilS [Rhizobiaceae bacterium]|nr:tRNA lysidine(34) synthetase TilS [Rhizobiaceae bacterium]MCV0408740.1 tRNA lysidine(34) synthetase TilS [Rhizobiaceae bacterium]
MPGDRPANSAKTPFDELEPGSRSAIVAAVSGGSDSLALLVLLNDWLAGDPVDLLAVTVDHGLRPESAAEAEAVARFCARLGIRHRTMRWTGAKPATGIAEAARLARYRLLAEAAEMAGTDLVLTGHTADDLAETVAMRAARGDGAGTAGMAPATLYENRVWFVRPLLGTRRVALQSLLRERGIDWVSDPTNEDPRFERARLRKQITADDHDRLIEQARGAALRRTELVIAAARLIETAADMPSPGLIRLDRGRLNDAPLAEAVHALRLLLATVGGREYLLDPARTAALLTALTASRQRRAIAGTNVEARGETVFLWREWRGDGPRPVEINQGNGIFDGRFRLSGPPGTRVAPRGKNTDPVGPVPRDVPPAIARAALACEPLLPTGTRAERILPPYRLLLPSFDLRAAGALARLFGAAPPADSPLC